MYIKKTFVCIMAGALLLTGCGGAGNAYKNGIKAYENGAYEEALEQFETALSLNPNKAEYYIEKGMTLIQLERFGEARSALEWMLLDNSMELVRMNNKRANYGIGITYFHEGEYALAKEYFEKAYAEELLAELNEEIVIYLTEAYGLLGDKENALRLYETWLTAENGTAADFYKRGQLRYESGDLKGSIADFDCAIDKNPLVFEFYFGKINALFSAGKEEERIRTLKNAAKLDHLSAQEAFFLAMELLAVKETKKAEELFEQAGENGINEAYYYLGELRMEREEYTAATDCYQKYISGSGAEDAFAYNQLALCFSAQGEYALALENIKKGLNFCNKQNEEELLFNQVVLLEKLGEYRDAYDYAKRFSELFPENEALLKELKLLDAMLY